MNLKEAFRYQRFLDGMMTGIGSAMRNRTLCLNTAKTHHYSKADPTIEDLVEIVEKDFKYTVDDLIAIGCILVDERRKLTAAINAAKASLDFDIDAAVEQNKFINRMCSSMRSVLGYSAGKRKERDRSYRFNVAGDQTAYYYDIDIIDEEAYDRTQIKDLAKRMTLEADAASTKIDEAMVNTAVGYAPAFDVNDSVDDLIDEYLSRKD